VTIQKACAIRDCTKTAKINSTEYRADRFALCEDCEMSVFLDSILNVEQDGRLPVGMTHEIGIAFNAFRRVRKGASLTHKSGVVTTMKEVRAGQIILPN
jgi:hypothetical protein